MREITKLMINEFNMKKLGFDFMGYNFDRTKDLSFHHMIISHKDCKKRHIEAEGYLYWNGAILVQDTAHEYLHQVENIDREIFEYITQELIQENKKGKIDKENLKRIRELLLYFEKEHCSDRNSKGKLIIKDDYIRNRIRL